MRRLLAVLLLLPALAALALAGAAFAAWQREPVVPASVPPTTAELARALATLQRLDPRKGPPGQPQVLSVPQRELDLALRQAVSRWNPRAAADLRLHQFAATLRLSVPTPAWAPPGWINIEAQVLEDEGLPVLHHLVIGDLSVPSPLAGALLQAAAPALGRAAGVPLQPARLAEVVQQVQLAPQVAVVSLTWQRDSVSRLLAGAVTPEEQQRLRAYQEHLSELTGRQPPGATQPLPGLLAGVFALAQQRSQGSDADAAAENRAALAVLAFYATGRRLSTLVPEARGWATPRPLRLTLRGREDFPQHLLASAVLASHGSTPLADAVGLHKELLDARRGSGFSFNDMAANRAGTRLGDQALRAPRRLQQQLAAGIGDADLLPEVSDLPEFMPEGEFLRRYGGVGSSAYRRIAADIEARLDALPLLR